MKNYTFKCPHCGLMEHSRVACHIEMPITRNNTTIYILPTKYTFNCPHCDCTVLTHELNLTHTSTVTQIQHTEDEGLTSDSAGAIIETYSDVDYTPYHCHSCHQAWATLEDIAQDGGLTLDTTTNDN